MKAMFPEDWEALKAPQKDGQIRVVPEDVERLREIANNAEGRHDESLELSDYLTQLWAESLAVRLERFLPPEVPHGK